MLNLLAKRFEVAQLVEHSSKVLALHNNKYLKTLWCLLIRLIVSAYDNVMSSKTTSQMFGIM